MMKKRFFGLQSYIHPSPPPPFTTSLLANLLLLWEKDLFIIIFKELPFSWNNNQINRLFLSFLKGNGHNPFLKKGTSQSRIDRQFSFYQRPISFPINYPPSISKVLLFCYVILLFLNSIFSFFSLP